MAASRLLRVLGLFPRSVSNWSRNARTSGGVNLLQRQLGWLYAKPVCAEAIKQLTAVRVSLARLIADSTLSGQMFSQKVSQMRCNRRHDIVPPLCMASPAAEFYVIRIGVACRYQYV